jgi:phospholipase D1/2
MLHGYSNCRCEAIHGTSEAGTGTVTKILAATGLKSKGHDTTAGDEALDEERMTYTRDGQKVPGFADAVVPTLEEKTVEEQRPLKLQANGGPIRDHLQEDKQGTDNGALDQARTQDGELFGAPADASKSPKSDDEPPHERSGIMDADDQEQCAPGARAVLRKHLQGKLGSKTWTLPTPRPEVDPEGFEDPISDAFWKNVWVACAAHNVSATIMQRTSFLLTFC